MMMLNLLVVWIAFLIGVVIGWAWKPRWACLFRNYFGLQPSCFNSIIQQHPTTSCSNTSSAFDSGFSNQPSSHSITDSSKPQVCQENSLAVTQEDLGHLIQLVEMKDGGPSWVSLMECTTPNMSYQAWRRDDQTGPPQYRNRTVYEDASPELLRDFFWDDEFRLKWDDMLVQAATVEECTATGTMVVHWIRKFPFFCSHREYIIGRRIWVAGKTYYCVTKGVPCHSIPRQNKPRRVDLYYSSWYIRPVESRRGDGQLTACEVIFFHHEEMGIPREIAKFAVRQGMWTTVTKLERGLRAYQEERAFGAALSRTACMGQINTKVSPEFLRYNGSSDKLSETEAVAPSGKSVGRNIQKLLIIGGAVILACSIDRGLLTKAIIFGMGRRFAKIGKRL